MLKLTGTSDILIKKYLKQYTECKYIYKRGEKSILDKYLKEFLKELKGADKDLEANFKDCKIIDKKRGLIGKLQYSGTFFPNNIKKYIESNECIKKTFIMNISKREINLNFYMYSKIPNINYYAYIVFLWFSIAGKYAVGNCSRVINIDIYLTPFKKELPKIKKVLDSENANTAFTYSNCGETGQIIIYRKEEWFKVLIHETFHNLNLDFSGLDITNSKTKMAEKIKIQSDFAIAEIYCETWARILNVVIITYIFTKYENNNSFLSIANNLIQLERLYSINQCNKVLNYNNLIIQDLFKIESMTYKENTNIFCYYIGVAIMMNNYYDFFRWCDKYNKNLLQFNNRINNVDIFVDFVLEKIKLCGLYNTLECIKKDRSLSMRMSILEF